MNLALIQIKNLINEALSQIALLEAANDEYLINCKHCDSPYNIKYGSGKKGDPRYLCKNPSCNKQFTIPKRSQKQ